jgi:phosphoglucosamine mutase
MFDSALEAGISAAGVDVRLLGPLPTPGIAYLTRTLSAQAGIVISASHNAYTDNGIKFFGADGRKLNDEIELEIERLLDEDMSVVATDQIGKVRRIDDARGRYIEFCKSTVPGLNLSGMKIVVDTANGAAYHIAPDVFEELGAEVVAMANSPDGFNINRDCGSTHPEQLQQRVLDEKADLGVALDGDADRLIMVDHTGKLVDGDQLLFVVARDRKESGVELPGVVGTLMSNFGLELALQVLAALSRRDQSLAEAVADVVLMPQTMINVRGPNRDGFMEKAEVKAAMAEVEQKLGGNGRILLRPSGTEPLVRVMIEGKDPDQVAALCRDLADVVEKAIA